MQQSGVTFGTSGARGLAEKMTDRLCYAYTKGFLQYLQQSRELLSAGTEVAIAGDLRPSTGRIMAAVAAAASDMGYTPVNAGRIPSPAVALYGLNKAVPAIMVTGSHIPADRNGIKFNKASGEVLKTDEQGIVTQTVDLPAARFDESGMFVRPVGMPMEDESIAEDYVRRYLDVFPSAALAGVRMGFYQHSAVGRDLLPRIFEQLGAEVVRLGYSETFVPVDTEAVRREDVALARRWSEEQNLDFIFSTDGDSDRPLISDENGEWLRGDVAGILAATFLRADSISTPVSCNTAVEKCGAFAEVWRTRIGSPYVIASMLDAADAGQQRIVGYEANGGFLTNSDIPVGERALPALPTRDAVLPALAILLLAKAQGSKISELVNALPSRYTLSDRIQNFPKEESARILRGLDGLDAINTMFGSTMGEAVDVDRTDGVRITFARGHILHMRPSGNAPEFRCYAEAESPQRVGEVIDAGMEILRRQM